MSPDALSADRVVPPSFDKEVLLSELERDEALRLKPYRDSKGLFTIGIGRCLDTTGISEAEARYLLSNDVTRTVADLDAHLAWWRDLDAVRQRAIINMAFNLGIGGLLKFERTLADLRAGNFVGAANGMLESAWSRQVGVRAQRLAKMVVAGAT